MSIKKKNFVRGITLRPDDIGVDGIEGEIKVGLTSKKLHAYLDGALRSIVTESQVQTLTNKTIDADNNPVSNLEVDNLKAGVLVTDTTLTGATDSQLPSAAVVKTLYDSNVLKTTGPVSATDDAITRFNGTTGKLVQNSPLRITDAGVIEPTATDATVTLRGNNLGQVNIGGGVAVVTTGTESNLTGIPSASSVTGNLVLDPGKNIRLNSNAISPINTIEAQLGGVTTMRSGQEITLLNVSGGDFVLNNLSGTPTTQRILTGTGNALTLRNGDSISLVYNSNEAYWQVIASSFKNSSTSTLDNSLARFDGTTGQFVQESGVILTDSEEMSGLTKLTVDNVVLDAASVAASGANDLTLDVTDASTHKVVSNPDLVVNRRSVFNYTTDSATTGANASVPFVNSKQVRLTNASLTSIDTIQAYGDTQEVTLINLTGNSLVINDETGTTATHRILTGTGSAIKLKSQASLNLTYDVVSQRWLVVGGTGGGATTINKIAGEDLALNDLVYVSTGTGNDSARTAGRLYKVDPANDDRIETLGFVSTAATAGNEAEVTTGGILDTFSGLTVGAMYFASLTTGAISSTPPSENGQWAISVGLAVSATELAINPVASASATYIQDSETTFTIANNVSSATDVTGLLLDPVINRSFMIDYSIYRQTDTASSALAQAGQLRGVYNSQAGTFYIADDFIGQNAGVTFSITIAGQIQYTSTDIAGLNYAGTLKYNVRKTFGV